MDRKVLSTLPAKLAGLVIIFFLAACQSPSLGMNPTFEAKLPITGNLTYTSR